MRLPLFAMLLLALSTTPMGGGCKREEKAPEKPTSSIQWYRVSLAAAVGEIPFLMSLPTPLPESGTLSIVNAEEIIEYAFERSDDEIVAKDRVFGTALLFRLRSDGRLEGEWEQSVHVAEAERVLALRGEPVDSPDPKNRFPAGGAPSVDVSGDWILDITGVGAGRAHFVQRPDGVVTGSMIPQDIGDLRYLSGRISGSHVVLSTFDGQHNYLVSFEVKVDGKSFEGFWAYPGVWNHRLAGRRGEPPSLGELHTTRVESEDGRVTLEALDALRGQPVIVDFFGTWCPACLDLTPVLADLHRRYAGQGLKILSIDLEPLDDAEQAREHLRQFKDKHKIPWEIDLRLVDDVLGALPPELKGAEGFPLTLFVRRDGVVAGVHSGFVSKAAPTEHKALVDKFDALTREILESRAESE